MCMPWLYSLLLKYGTCWLCAYYLMLQKLLKNHSLGSVLSIYDDESFSSTSSEDSSRYISYRPVSLSQCQLLLWKPCSYKLTWYHACFWEPFFFWELTLELHCMLVYTSHATGWCMKVDVHVYHSLPLGSLIHDSVGFWCGHLICNN